MQRDVFKSLDVLLAERLDPCRSCAISRIQTKRRNFSNQTTALPELEHQQVPTKGCCLIAILCELLFYAVVPNINTAVYAEMDDHFPDALGDSNAIYIDTYQSSGPKIDINLKGDSYRPPDWAGPRTQGPLRAKKNSTQATVTKTEEESLPATSDPQSIVLSSEASRSRVVERAFSMKWHFKPSMASVKTVQQLTSSLMCRLHFEYTLGIWFNLVALKF